jgi:hypothetical protein
MSVIGGQANSPKHQSMITKPDVNYDEKERQQRQMRDDLQK